MGLCWISLVGCQQLEHVDSGGPGGASSAAGSESDASSSGSESTTSGSSSESAASDEGSGAAVGEVPGCDGVPPDSDPPPRSHGNCGGVACACDELCLVLDDDNGCEPSITECRPLPSECDGRDEYSEAAACFAAALCTTPYGDLKSLFPGALVCGGRIGQCDLSDTE